MRTLTVNATPAGASSMLRRRGWMLYDHDHPVPHIAQVGFRRPPIELAANAEPVIIAYPRYCVGRIDEADYVHLPSYPSRILWRALTGTLTGTKS